MKNWKQEIKLEKSSFFSCFLFFKYIIGGFAYGRNKSIIIKLLQDLVNQKKLGLNSAEHISFIDNKNQFIISKIIENYNYNITDSLAQRIKEDYYNCKMLCKEYLFSKDKIDKYQNEKRIKVKFTQEEIERYFIGYTKII